MAGHPAGIQGAGAAALAWTPPRVWRQSAGGGAAQGPLGQLPSPAPGRLGGGASSGAYRGLPRGLADLEIYLFAERLASIPAGFPLTFGLPAPDYS